MNKQFLLRKWPCIFTTALLFYVLSSWVGFADEQEIRFAVISDHRSSFQGLVTALEFIDAQNVDFIFVLGDFDQTKAGYTEFYSRYGYLVDKERQPDRQKIYFILGNHDSPPSGDTFFQNNIAPYYPDNGPNQAPLGTIFSFDRGYCHFTVTNQYWDYAIGGYTQEQLGWIEQDLTLSSKPFKFVFGHEPAFPLHNHVGDSLDSDPSMRDAFWQILMKKGVQAFFCGHTHFYSAVKNGGIYQLDAGEARKNHICVMIVKVNPETAIVHSYETNGSLPIAKDKIDTIILKPSNAVPAAHTGP